MPYLTPFTLAFVFSLLCVPVVRWIGFKTGCVSVPRKERWHRQPTPTLGGVGIFAAFVIALVATCVFYQRLPGHWNLLSGAVVMFVLGVIDDFKRISPPVKLAGQLLAATLFIATGSVIEFFPWPIANILLTYFWLVGISNAINLLDNMDGLAGGVSLIAALMLSYFNWHIGDLHLAWISLALAGGILGFLVFNFPPARIFMGDSGSMFLGFTLAALAVARRSQASSVLAVMGVPVMLFLLPILDTTLVTITRILRGQSPTQGGTDHASHRLVAFGLSERQAVLVLYGVAVIAGLSAIFLEARDYVDSLVLTPLVLIAFSLFAAYLARLKVVSSSNQINHGGLAQRVVNLAYRRRLFELLFDLTLIGISYYMAYWVSYGLDMTVFSMGLFLRSWPIALGCAYLSFFILGVYRGVWRYVGASELLRYAVAAGLSTVVTLGLLRLFLFDLYASADVFLMFAIFLFLGLTGSRLSFQVLDRLYQQRQPLRPDAQRVLLYGSNIDLVLRWLLENPAQGYLPVGCLDDDPGNWGAQIHGIDVFGGPVDLERILAEQQVDGLLLTGFPDEAALSENLLPVCQQRGIWLRRLRLIFEPLT